MRELSRQIKNLELCIHKDPRAYPFIKKMLSERKRDNYNKNSDLELISGSLKYPIIDLTKTYMEEERIKTNYIY